MTIKIHLVLLVHGLWGSNNDLGAMKSKLTKQLSNVIEESDLNNILENPDFSSESDFDSSKQYSYFYACKSNNRFRTYDGVEMCGKRLQLELYNLLCKFDNLDSLVVVNKISFISYSLGGLMSRYCLGLLHNDGFFDYKENGEQKYEFINFITFVSPHVGVISKDSRVAKLIGHSGVQLYLKDKDKLVYQMSLPSSSFVQGLKNFKHFKLYSNCINDIKTNFFTTGISHADPFIDLYEKNTKDVKWLKFIPKYEGLIIDYESSHLNNDENEKECKKIGKKFPENTDEIVIGKDDFQFEEELSKELDVDVELPVTTNSKSVNKIIAIYDKVVSILLLLLFVLLRTPFEICLSYYRRSKMIKLYKEDFKLINHIKIGNLNINNVAAEEEEDSINNSDTDDHETTPMLLATAKSNEEVIAASFNTPEKTPFSIAKRTLNSIMNKNAQPSLYLKELIDLKYEDLFHLKQTFFNFELVDPSDFELQHQIIHNLNNGIEWERYPVIIRKSKFSHAAIIARYDKPKENFEEGLKVMDHLAENIVI